MLGLKDMAQRITNAEDDFVAMLVEQHSITIKQAWGVLNTFIKHKMMKLDPVGGVYNVKHGMMLDAKTIAGVVAYL